ncbi:MAG: ribonuclease P protein component [Spirochaetaceae bacterium]|jgi:ribonuclease P protein component|nr:ribonuclease P protein component [Spirochaetaceae bacterium]
MHLTRQPKEQCTFSRNERIGSSKEIRALFQGGKKVSVPGAKLFFMKTTRSETRFAVTLPRKYGAAVERNRTKRLCRESFRTQKARFAQGYDMLFLVYQTQHEDLRTRASQVFLLAKKAGLLVGRNHG